MKKIILTGLTVLLLAVLAGCMTGSWRPGDGYGYHRGPGMMGDGYGPGGYGQGYGPGVMGQGYGPGMMGEGYGPGMMGWGGYPAAGGKETLSMDQASEAVARYIGNSVAADLVVAEIMEFDNHFYAAVKEKSTGIYAFEVLVNKWSGAVGPEPGPNIMWNTKYGHMGAGMMSGGMMGSPSWGWGGRRGYRNWDESNKEMSVTPEQARKNAQEFLDERLPGTMAGEGADAFYGYYTLHVEKDGKTVGMLGVNGYTGWVWYHEWHGKFISMKETH